MKLLFDQNISFRITKLLNEFFLECKHVSECELLDSEDSEIWLFAKKNNYTIVTFDSDFYEISLINGHPPKIIWIRTGNLTTKNIVTLFINKKEVISDFLNKKEFKEITCLEVELLKRE